MALLPFLIGVSGGFMGFLLAETLDEDSGETSIDVLEMRNPESLSLSTRKVIDLITIQPNINPVGSQRYKIQRYPSDIDLFEKYKACCDIETASAHITEKLRKIGKEIKHTNNVYFGDFKAGLDHRFDIELGEIDYLNNTVKGYDQHTVITKISSWLAEGILSDSEYTDMIYLANQPFNFANYEKLRDMIKEKHVVRWTNDELINGKKVLSGNRRLTLEEAITHKTAVKIDVWAKTQGSRFTEITNFFLLIYIDEKGEEHILNLEMDDLINSFLKDIILYSTEEHKKSLKFAKRVWQLATYINYQEMLNKLYPLFKSDIGLLNQMASDIEVIINMLEYIPKPPYREIIDEINEFKPRLGSFQTPEVELDEQRIFLLLDDITLLLINSTVDNEERTESPEELDKGMLIRNLQYLQDYLLEIVETYSAGYLERINVTRDEVIDYVAAHRQKRSLTA